MQNINNATLHDSLNIRRAFIRAFSYLNHNIVELGGAIALVLISQTRLRFVGLPFGLGELLLMLLPCLALFRRLRTIKLEHKSVSIYCTEFVNLTGAFFLKLFPFVLLSCSLFSAYWLGKQSPMSNDYYFVHNILAYTFVGLFFLSLFYLDIDFILMGFMFSILLFSCLSLELLVLPGYQLFYYGIRFSGLADNPNQLAISILPTFFFIILYIKKMRFNWISAIPLCTLSIIFAYISHSSALILAYVFAIVCIFISSERIRADLMRYRWPITAMLIACLFLIAAVDLQGQLRFYKLIQAFYSQAAEGVDEGIRELRAIRGDGVSDTLSVKVIKDSDAGVNPTMHNATSAQEIPAQEIPAQDNHLAFSVKYSGVSSLQSSLYQQVGSNISEVAVRLRLWSKAITMMSDHPLFGYGAGACIGMKLETVTICEIHNTLIDVIYQSGFIGGAGLLLFLFITYREINSYDETKSIYRGLFISILIFSIFHFTIRHPIVWFIFAYILATSFQNSSALNTERTINVS